MAETVACRDCGHQCNIDDAYIALEGWFCSKEHYENYIWAITDDMYYVTGLEEDEDNG